MREIKFYIPEGITIPTELMLLVDGKRVDYERLPRALRFWLYDVDAETALDIVREITDKIRWEHDESQHGVSWVTKSLEIVPQEERYKIGEIVEWKYRVRDSY